MSASHVVLGAGPVGRAVVVALTSRGIEPAVVTRSGGSVPGATSRRADLTDPVQATEALAGAAVVFQCAQPAYHRWPAEFPELQARAVAAATSAGALLVAAENLYGYGPVDGPVTQDLPLTATTRKGVVRAQMWRDLEAAHQAGQLRVVAARASDFFGPGVEDSAVGERFFRPLGRGKAVRVVGNPDQLHTYTYVPDFGEAMVRLSETPDAWGRAWHVPNAPTITTPDLRRACCRAGGHEAAPPGDTPLAAALLGRFVPAIGEVVEMLYEFEEDFVVDHASYATLLGDHATPLDDALSATLE
jgi:nucleoside-diphosphate-sugar epimerase